MKQALLIASVAIIALLAGFFSRQASPPAPKAKPVDLSTVHLPDLNGEMRKLSDWQGKLLVINFWATWCTPCRKEIPEFIALQKQYRNHNVQFIGIAIDNLESTLAYASTVNFNYPILISGDNGISLSQQFGNSFSIIPYTVIINPTGEIIHQHTGEFTHEQITTVLNTVLSAATRK